MTKRSHLFFIGLLIIIGIVMLIVVNPIGNFPLNDDWTYGASVKASMAAGSFKVPDASACAIFTQVMWGILFSKLFGFSYTILRLSTLMLAGIGLIALYLLAYEITQNKKLSFFAALLLLVNPFYFSLSNTFMTDVPGLSLSILSCLFFFKALSKSNSWYVILGTFFSVAAILTRQAAIIIPLAYSFAVLFTQKNSYKHWARIIIPPVFANVVLFLFMSWMKHANPLFETYQGSASMFTFLKDIPGLVFRIFIRAGNILCYCGFFLLPILLFVIPKVFMTLSLRHKKIVSICAIVFIPCIIRMWSALPTGNLLNSDGLGPRLLRDTYLLFVNVHPVSDAIIHLLVCLAMIGALLTVVGCSIVLVNTASAIKRRAHTTDNSRRVFLLVFLLGYCMLVFMPFSFFDRYTLPAFFIILLVVISAVPASSYDKTWYTPILFTSFIGLFSIFSTHDYLAWNRARWQALDYLTKDMHVSPLRIDGGYEYNGVTFGSGHLSTEGKSWWYVSDDEFMISFGPVDGCKIIKQFDYCNYLPLKEDCIYIVQRK